MKKVIIDNNSFGYHWSNAAQLELAKRKHYEYELYAIVSVAGFKKIVHLDDDEFLETDRYLKWNSDGCVERVGINILSGDGFFCVECPDRQDEDAIAMLEDLGSEYCSGKDSCLVVKEYDEEYFTPSIVPGPHGEILHLLPFIKERILACKDVHEVYDYLDDHGMFFT